MLLAQPFDPLKEQQRKPPFFSRFQLFAKTKRAIGNLKNRRQVSRELQNRLLSQQFMLPAPPFPLQPVPGPQPWYGYCCCHYDPYTIVYGPPLPLPLQPVVPFSPPQMPYSICVHYNKPYEQQFNSKHPSPSGSTLYSARSSFDDEEKEQVEENTEQLRRPRPQLMRSNSDILHDRQQIRPTMIHRWNSHNDSYYYS